jgi:hypothetical protein
MTGSLLRKNGNILLLLILLLFLMLLLLLGLVFAELDSPLLDDALVWYRVDHLGLRRTGTAPYGVRPLPGTVPPGDAHR